ncbi:hypothetical protein [Neomoorella thermoacetica]|uniref:hypothetical protein n=1 Tax=Neomoorella thermoacetica TaxID=1525 RepID=UPI0008FB7DC1|nr:hypothetical protein [Moorella thermoacetica]OIQ53814.1 hypothetical protein MORE_17920 [Moorella thermoacetica]
MLKDKLVTLLKECPWLLEKTVEDPQVRHKMQEQVYKKIAELEGAGYGGSCLPSGEIEKVA